jgi:hypothetical protein
MTMKNAQDFVTEYAQEVAPSAGVAGNNMVPLYGLGQASNPVVWYQRPIVIFPIGIAVGVGIGWGIWGWFMPRLRKNVRKSMKDEE